MHDDTIGNTVPAAPEDTGERYHGQRRCFEQTSGKGRASLAAHPQAFISFERVGGSKNFAQMDHCQPEQAFVHLCKPTSQAMF